MDNLRSSQGVRYHVPEREADVMTETMAAAPEAVDLVPPVDRAGKYTVLIVDDEPEIRRLMSRRLQSEGYRVVEAADGLRGLEAVKEHGPDIVLCDVFMPRFPGSTMLTTLRTKHPEYADIPFIFITGQRGREKMISAINSGADDYLTKPLDVDLLLSKIRSTLGRVTRMEQKKQADLENLRASVLRVLPHELRTPLTHILGFSEMLKSGAVGRDDGPKYDEYIDAIHSGGEQLLNIVNRTLEVVDAISGHTSPDLQSSDAVDLIESAIQRFDHQFDRPDRTFECRFTEAPMHVFADPALFQQVIDAVISNAIKFSGDGVRMLIDVKPADGNSIEIRVSDEGVGINEDELPYVFDAFSQHGKGIGRKFQGIGLGLTLVKVLVDLMGGATAIESKVGVGTTVTLRFKRSEL